MLGALQSIVFGSSQSVLSVMSSSEMDESVEFVRVLEFLVIASTFFWMPATVDRASFPSSLQIDFVEFCGSRLTPSQVGIAAAAATGQRSKKVTAQRHCPYTNRAFCAMRCPHLVKNAGALAPRPRCFTQQVSVLVHFA